MGMSRERKVQYFERTRRLFEEYQRILFVTADNVGSYQMQQIRAAVRKDSVILMGKNTMIRKAVAGLVKEKPELEVILPLCTGNTGLVFTRGDLAEVRGAIASNKVPAAARAGTFAQCDVVIPPGPTGMEPTMTSFFQALNIPTKINKGQIEIQSEVKILVEGQRVGNSEVALLQKLDIKPFSYGLQFGAIYEEGSVYNNKVLDITDESLMNKVNEAIGVIAQLSLGMGHPTACSMCHMVLNGYRKLVEFSLGTDYTMPQIEELKKILEDPEALAAMASAAAAAPTGAAAHTGDTGGAATEEAAPAAEEEEEDEDMGFSLFD
eukprot:CAMPEP_0184689140 /NCGR_PEP_ID=MMETSP0312-20130426/30489_1 /TAXON_ID=31354 /ORGANISM="Compsopogon coeruleus, Strain SAG 36.94" /LENGTH=321 /DNA_ID=CAMNT_0027146455 /DNA_START=333 /DNA_END=1298 /DNA_ORIENTATION=-